MLKHKTNLQSCSIPLELQTKASRCWPDPDSGQHLTMDHLAPFCRGLEIPYAGGPHRLSNLVNAALLSTTDRLYLHPGCQPLWWPVFSWYHHLHLPPWLSLLHFPSHNPILSAGLLEPLSIDKLPSLNIRLSHWALFSSCLNWNMTIFEGPCLFPRTEDAYSSSLTQSRVYDFGKA